MTSPTPERIIPLRARPGGPIHILNITPAGIIERVGNYLGKYHTVRDQLPTIRDLPRLRRRAQRIFGIQDRNKAAVRYRTQRTDNLPSLEVELTPTEEMYFGRWRWFGRRNVFTVKRNHKGEVQITRFEGRIDLKKPTGIDEMASMPEPMKSKLVQRVGRRIARYTKREHHVQTQDNYRDLVGFLRALENWNDKSPLVQLPIGRLIRHLRENVIGYPPPDNKSRKLWAKIGLRIHRFFGRPTRKALLAEFQTRDDAKKLAPFDMRDQAARLFNRATQRAQAELDAMNKDTDVINLAKKHRGQWWRFWEFRGFLARNFMQRHLFEAQRDGYDDLLHNGEELLMEEAGEIGDIRSLIKGLAKAFIGVRDYSGQSVRDLSALIADTLGLIPIIPEDAVELGERVLLDRFENKALRAWAINHPDEYIQLERRILIAQELARLRKEYDYKTLIRTTLYRTGVLGLEAKID